MSREMNLDAQDAAGWRPEPGDTVIGRITALDWGWSDWSNERYPIVTVQPDEGDPIAIHAFHTVLADRFATLRPRVGERLGVKYKGEQPSKDGRRSIHVYTVRIADREDDGSFWNGTQQRASNRQPQQREQQQAFSDRDFTDSRASADDDDPPF